MHRTKSLGALKLSFMLKVHSLNSTNVTHLRIKLYLTLLIRFNAIGRPLYENFLVLNQTMQPLSKRVFDSVLYKMATSSRNILRQSRNMYNVVQEVTLTLHIGRHEYFEIVFIIHVSNSWHIVVLYSHTQTENTTPVKYFRLGDSFHGVSQVPTGWIL
jgi:hypothetical protein